MADFDGWENVWDTKPKTVCEFGPGYFERVRECEERREKQQETDAIRARLLSIVTTVPSLRSEILK